MLRQRYRAVFTVEASYITAVVLLSLGLLLRFGFGIHDTVVGNAVLNEGLELAGHSDGADPAELSERGRRRMAHALSGSGFELRIEEEDEGYRGTAGGQRRRTEISDRGFHPEKFLRQITLLEGITGSGE